MKVLVAGDFCPMDRVSEILESRDYISIFDEVKTIVERADFSIVNFECPVCDGENKIEKCGPNLKCSERGIEAIQWAGFNCVSLANNHFFDYGEEGVRKTLSACKKYSINVVGGGLNLQEASKTLYKEISGEKLAIINCCEHEFSIATDNTAGSNPLSSVRQFYAIQEARKNADYVLVIVHGGHEHYQLPSPRMQDLYRFFIDVGADVVINHHQHCYSGYEVYKNKPIFYGLGNFCFDNKVKKDSIWNEGYMVCLSFDKELKYEVYPYEQCGSYPKVKLLDNHIFDEKIYELNSIISNRELLLKAYVEYCMREKNDIMSVFQPFRSRWAFAARRLKLLPSFMSKRWRIDLYNYILCESHRDKVAFFLKQKK